MGRLTILTFLGGAVIAVIAATCWSRGRPRHPQLIAGQEYDLFVVTQPHHLHNHHRDRPHNRVRQDHDRDAVLGTYGGRAGWYSGLLRTGLRGDRNFLYEGRPCSQAASQRSSLAVVRSISSLLMHASATSIRLQVARASRTPTTVAVPRGRHRHALHLQYVRLLRELFESRSVRGEHASAWASP